MSPVCVVLWPVLSVSVSSVVLLRSDRIPLCMANRDRIACCCLSDLRLHGYDGYGDEYEYGCGSHIANESSQLMGFHCDTNRTIDRYQYRYRLQPIPHCARREYTTHTTCKHNNTQHTRTTHTKQMVRRWKQ